MILPDRYGFRNSMTGETDKKQKIYSQVMDSVGTTTTVQTEDLSPKITDDQSKPTTPKGMNISYVQTFYSSIIIVIDGISRPLNFEITL